MSLGGDLADFDLYAIAAATVGPITDEQKKKIRRWEIDYVLEDFDFDGPLSISRDYMIEILASYAAMTRRTWESRRRYAYVYSNYALDLRADSERARDDLRRKIAKLKETSGRTDSEREIAVILIERLEAKIAAAL